mmetsp:Transcript_22331/g.54087  ORF Transcript_22331/g.54087 Transcript_22331/m.54087 type:complete len:1112 (+) Transcript_22331:42-3377(+)
MSGRPKRKRSRKASGNSYADGEVIDVDAADALEKDSIDTDGVQPQQGKKGSFDSTPSKNQQCEPLLNTHPHSQLPSYLSEAFSDLYSQDGLVVMGRGLGWLGLLCSFVRFYGDAEGGYAAASSDEENDADEKNGAVGRQRGQKKKPPLIFVLNLHENERQVVLSTLASWGTPTDQLPRIIASEAGSSEERATLYAQGGTFIITSRILIVDLLTGVANARDIEGMLVAHAEKVVGDKSMEAFILRIFRGQKYFMKNYSASGAAAGGNNVNGGFIKAFTDDPSGMVSGFAKVDKILKSLQVQRLYLYPRFHAAVADELERQPPTVVELEVPLSDKMKEIQNTLAAAMRACLRDLRQKCQRVDLSFLFDAGGGKRKRKRDATDDYGLNNYAKGTKGDNIGDWKFSIQQCIATNFAYILGRQLEGDWHHLSWEVKQRISDLRTIGSMFHYLIEYDCVQFWKLLQGIKSMSASSKNQSDWLLQPAGEKLFRLAKERVYRLINVKGQTGVKLQRVLEEKPKERLLHQVLTEIENRWSSKQRKTQEGKEDGSPPFTPSASANVLLMVKDERALQSIRSFLSGGGGKHAVTKSYLHYLDSVVEKVQPTIRPGGLDVASLPIEQRLLYEEHGGVKNLLFGPAKTNQRKQAEEEDRKKLSNWKKKHRRIIEEKTRGVVTADTIRQKALLEEAIQESAGDMTTIFQGKDYSDDSSANSSSSDDEDEIAYKVEPIEAQVCLFIRSFSKLGEGEATLLLHDIQPKYVVMYDSDPSFIRTLEIYSNSMIGESSSATLAEKERLQVFFLLYQASAEEINFLKSLEREKEAFKKLIDHKKRMPTSLPTFNNFSTQEMQQACGGVGGSYAGGKLPLSMDTRTGGGKQKASKERRDIAVDVREFRSALPSVLHQGGMRLAPASLTVGDFVLSNVHCVERKSISDLYGSFNSGRLYDQAEAMVKHYKCPCLLIEFDPDKTFSLQSTNDLGGEIRNDCITSKLTLLTMKFPSLRLLWSRSPHETLKIFKKLKRNHQEVDVDKAIDIGSNESLDLLGGDGYYEDEENDGANEAARKMLLHLPGVNAHNARKIMSECGSIAELAELSREELRRIAGPVAGQKLFKFFRQNFEA